MQLKVVWSLLLKTGSEGPNPHLLCSYAQIGHLALIALVAHFQIEIDILIFQKNAQIHPKCQQNYEVATFVSFS